MPISGNTIAGVSVAAGAKPSDATKPGLRRPSGLSIVV